MAGRVVLSAGGVYSPTLLLRSGIGPEEQLRQLGIATVADRPGVGQNLQNHSYSFFAMTLPPSERLASHLRKFAVAGLRASSGLANCPEGDLLLYMTGRVSGSSFGPDVAMVAAALYKPFSTGSISLLSADPSVNPKIEFRMLSDRRDAPRIVMAGRLVESLLRDRDVKTCYYEASLLPPALALNQFNRKGISGAVLAAGAKVALNSVGFVRRAAMRHAFPGAIPLDGVNSIRDEDLVSAICPMGHPTGTCAMGLAEDYMAVVDPHFRVYGVDNLSVVDASVMPSIPSANTNLPTLMLAETAAAKLLALS